MPAIVNLDGELVPPEAAKISIFDRGFLYGDSVYEVVRTYRGQLFELDAHLARLERSAQRIGMELKWNRARTKHELSRALEAAKGHDPAEADAAPWNAGERYVRIVQTRGAGEISLDPAAAENPVAIVIVRPLHGPPLAAYRRGVKGCLVGVTRNDPHALDPAAKTGNYLNSVLAIREAKQNGAFEAFMLDRAGFVTEGSSSNIMMVRGGELLTPPLSAGILEGVTRGVVLRLAAELGLPAREAQLTAGELRGADEIFITSTIREVVPVVTLGRTGQPDLPVGPGTPGPVFARLHAELRQRTGT